MADDSYLSALNATPPPSEENMAPQPSPLWPAFIGHLAHSVIDIPKNLIDTAAEAPPAGLRREDYTDIPGAAQPIDPLVKASTDQALGMAGRGMPMAETGAAGVFGGKLAKTANLRQLESAQNLITKGKAPEEVMKNTGWFQSPTDGQWRFEIPDNASSINHFPNNGFVGGPIEALYSHPELYKAYPQLRDFRMENYKADAPSGFMDLDKSLASVSAPTSKEARSIAAHEVQHGIQDIEGFQQGTDPREYAKVIEHGLKSGNGLQSYDYDKVREMSHQAYARTAGEVEARNVQKRLDYSPIKRVAQMPWESQDFPYDKQLMIDPQTSVVSGIGRNGVFDPIRAIVDYLRKPQ